MNTKVAGKLAEDYAHDYLRACNYHVAERNWFRGKDEIDIVAWALDSGQLVFVEVKALISKQDPLDNFSSHKEHCFKRAVEGYLDRHKFWDQDFRIDVITTNLDATGCVNALNHYQDVI